MTLTVISYGGGVQSTAMLVLAVEGRLGYDVDAALFANVGDDSEDPLSLAYVRDVATPWAAEHGLDVVEVVRRRRDGETETLQERVRGNHVGVVIPARGENGNPLTRGCTGDFKIAPIARWLRGRGASRADPADVLIGISVDEIERAGRGVDRPHERRRYPLLDLGLRRSDCAQLIRDAGLPVPPKSSCWFCPYHSRQVWAEMRRDRPDLFAQAVDLEHAMTTKLVTIGRRPVYLYPGGVEHVGEAQPSLLGDGWGEAIGETGCDEGVCFV